jgi:hypothetical protein
VENGLEVIELRTQRRNELNTLSLMASLHELKIPFQLADLECYLLEAGEEFTVDDEPFEATSSGAFAVVRGTRTLGALEIPSTKLLRIADLDALHASMRSWNAATLEAVRFQCASARTLLKEAQERDLKRGTARVRVDVRGSNSRRTLVREGGPRGNAHV